ncbi:gamma-aminobutyric acid receptor subunit beta-3-like isoform X1 [Acropora millepora]|uniref:gamma-aminobutyric acid receptor subunit beta-3-like isoform X1 n=1 Tax=Acropora millepora TaxID=45264 RepID=UPI0010FCA63E|nr:gamma-aminobutyric acid receptor subunit beta-3-like isoform X1 [Acropora millepora]
MWLTPTYLILFFGVLGSSRTASANAIMEEEAKEHAYEQEKTRNATAILNVLLRDYDNRLRPRFGGKPLTIYADLYIVDIGEISVTNMDYRMTMYFRQTWGDPRLQFNGTDPIVAQGNILDKIWIPDTYFTSEKKSNFHEVTKKNYVLVFFPNGTVFFSIRISLTGVCRMNLQTYPLDRQSCKLNIMSYSYTNTDAKYEWKQGPLKSVERSPEISLPQMDIVDIQASESVEIHSIGNYSRLSLIFTLKRRLSLFITETYVPSIMVVALSWVSFWINYKAAPARIALCITTVLTMITLTSSVQNSLPRVTYVKYSDWILTTCLAYVFGALVEFAIVNFHDSLETRKREKLNTKLHNIDLEGGIIDNLRYEDKAESADLKTRYLMKQLSKLREKLKSFVEQDVNVQKIDSRSRVLFPLTFLVINVIFWIYFIIVTSK